MVIIDGSLLLGIAAIVTSIATLWRTVRDQHQSRTFDSDEQNGEDPTCEQPQASAK